MASAELLLSEELQSQLVIPACHKSDILSLVLHILCLLTMGIICGYVGYYAGLSCAMSRLQTTSFLSEGRKQKVLLTFKILALGIKKMEDRQLVITLEK